MAEGLFRDRFERAGLDAHVHSAGLVTEDRAASAHGIDAMARRGIDIAGHRSRYLTPEQIESADLIVGMELQHVREAVVLDMDAFGRSFTLPELARTATALGPRCAEETSAGWIARAGAGRRPTDMLGSRPEDEVADPYGRSAREYEATAVELEGLVDAVFTHLFPVAVA